MLRILEAVGGGQRNGGFAVAKHEDLEVFT